LRGHERKGRSRAVHAKATSSASGVVPAKVACAGRWRG
jgi:hypothetical protein